MVSRNCRRLARIMVLTVVSAVALCTAAFGQSTLVVGLADGNHTDFYRHEIVPAFEAANPDITVELIEMGWSAEHYIVRYAGGTAPDVFQGGTGMFGLSAQGMFAPLNPLIEKYGWGHVIEEFPPSVVEALSIDGQLYGVPWSYSSDNFTYLANVFADAGLDPNRPPDTWDELVEFGRILTRYDAAGNIVFQGFWTDSHRNRFAPFLYQAGGTWMNADFSQAAFGSAYGLEAVEFLDSLFKEHRIIDQTRTLGDLDDGDAAMTFTSASIFQEGTSPFFDADDIRVGVPPMHRQRGQRITPNTWQIGAISTQQDAAFRWIMFVLELENVVKMGQQLNTLPVRMGAGAYPPWAGDIRWQIALESIQYGVIEPLTSPYWDFIRREYVTNTLDRVFYQGEPPSLIVEAERQANAWLMAQE